VSSKKFEQISPKTCPELAERICRAGGIPPKPPFRPPAEATLSDWTISMFFIPLLAELRASLSLAANSF